MFHYSLRIIDEPKLSEIRILNLWHKKSILVDIYRQSLLNARHIIHSDHPYVITKQKSKHKEPKPFYSLWTIPNQITNKIL